jgi:hypothetical protein
VKHPFTDFPHASSRAKINLRKLLVSVVGLSQQPAFQVVQIQPVPFIFVIRNQVPNHIKALFEFEHVALITPFHAQGVASMIEVGLDPRVASEFTPPTGHKPIALVDSLKQW